MRLPLQVQSPLQVSGVTSTSATVSWTTTQPASSQVEFGLTPIYGASSGLDMTLSTQHRQVLTGLLPGAIYHLRVDGADATGAQTSSPDVAFTTLRQGATNIDDTSAKRITATTALISWSAATSFAQVEYGLTPAYGSFTLLKTFTSPSQDITLDNLTPLSLYHYRVKTWDSTGAPFASPDFTFTTAAAQQATLLGNTQIDDRRTTIPTGQAFAFQYGATASGLARAIRVYVDSSSTAPTLGVGVFADDAGEPGVLLTQSTLQRPIAGAWNTVLLQPANLTQGMSYWISVLNPSAPGILIVRGNAGRGNSRTALGLTLSTLPSNFRSADLNGTTTVSAYVQQMAPSITLLEPVDGRDVTGSVTLSATIDSDMPVASVQFLIDDVPVGVADRLAPYSTTWNSLSSSTHEFHVVTARVTDSLGRIAVSAPVWVRVDNGAAIAQVTASAITSTSAWISWATDAASDSQVEFGLTSAYGQAATLDAALMWLHRQQLTGLRPGTTYHYRVRSRDLRGALGASQDATFTTLP